jgi:transcriptional regulator with XRE-family HTH domain
MTLEEVSQKDLAERIGVAPSTLSEWLKGKSVPSGQHLSRLAEVLDTEPQDLVLDRPDIAIGANSVVYNIFYAYYVSEGASVTINVTHAAPQTPAEHPQHAITPDAKSMK